MLGKAPRAVNYFPSPLIIPHRSRATANERPKPEARNPKEDRRPKSENLATQIVLKASLAFSLSAIALNLRGFSIRVYLRCLLLNLTVAP